jgi:hypothetical protein
MEKFSSEKLTKYSASMVKLFDRKGYEASMDFFRTRQRTEKLILWKTTAEREKESKMVVGSIEEKLLIFLPISFTPEFYV